MTSALRQLTARVPAALRGDYVSLAAGGIVEAAGSAIAVIVLVRSVDIGAAGEVTIAQAVAAVFFMIGDPRFDDVVIKFFPEVQARQGDAEAHGFYRLMRRWDVLVSLALGAAFLATSVVGGWSWTGAPEDLLILAGFAAAAQSAALAPIGVFSVTGGLRTYGRLRSGLAVLGAAAQVTGVVIGDGAGFLIGTAAGATVSTVVYWTTATVRARRQLGPPRKHHPLGLGRVGRFTAMASVGTSVAAGVERLPMIALGAVASPAAAAAFRVALAPGRSLSVLVSPVTAMQFPKLSKEAVDSELSESLRRLRLQSHRFAVAGMVLAVLATPFLIWAVPMVYGGEYRDAAGAACILFAVSLLRYSQPWSKVLALVLGRPGLRAGVVAADGATVVGLTFGLAATWPLGGAVVAYAAGALLAFVLWEGIAKRASGGTAGAAPFEGGTPAVVIE